MRPVIFVFVVFASVLSVVAITKWRTPPELVPWQSDYAAAKAQATSGNKPLLLYFTAEWCGPCQEMRREVWSDARVAEAMKSVVPVRIDVDRQAQLATQYRAEEGIPLFIVFDSAGNPQKKRVGRMDADEFMAWLALPGAL